MTLQPRAHLVHHQAKCHQHEEAQSPVDEMLSKGVEHQMGVLELDEEYS